LCDPGHDVGGEVVRRPGQRAVGAHATGVGAGIVVPDPLEVLRRHQGHGGRAVAEAEERHLRSVEELLDDHPTVGFGQAGGGMVERDLALGGDDDALAGGQAVLLDHMRGTEGIEGVLDLGQGRADMGQPGRHLGGRHDVLGEGLAPLEPRRLGRRPETCNPLRDKGIGHTRDQRCLRADNDQIHAQLSGQGHDALRRGGAALDVATERKGRDAGVAGRSDHGIHGGVGTEGPDEGVLTRTAAEDENLHEDDPSGEQK